VDGYVKIGVFAVKKNDNFGESSFYDIYLAWEVGLFLSSCCEFPQAYSL